MTPKLPLLLPIFIRHHSAGYLKGWYRLILPTAARYSLDEDGVRNGVRRNRWIRIQWWRKQWIWGAALALNIHTLPVAKVLHVPYQATNASLHVWVVIVCPLVYSLSYNTSHWFLNAFFVFFYWFTGYYPLSWLCAFIVQLQHDVLMFSF